MPVAPTSHPTHVYTSLTTQQVDTKILMEECEFNTLKTATNTWSKIISKLKAANTAKRTDGSASPSSTENNSRKRTNDTPKKRRCAPNGERHTPSKRTKAGGVGAKKGGKDAKKEQDTRDNRSVRMVEKGQTEVKLEELGEGGAGSEDDSTVQDEEV